MSNSKEKPGDDVPLYPVEPDVIRFKLATLFPFYNNIIYRLIPKEQKGFRTFGVTPGWRWYYGDLVPMTQEEQVWALFHECNHLLRGHAVRCGDRDHGKWNWAGDMEINDWTPPSLKQPDFTLTPGKFGMEDGELAEFYYSNMPEAEYHVRVDATATSPGTGACEDHGDSCDGSDIKAQAGDGKGKAPVLGRFHGPRCGAVSPSDPGDGSEGDQAEGPAVGEYEAEAIRHQVAKEIKNEASKGRGNVPAGIARWANELLDPQVPWQKLLRTAVRRATVQISGQQDHTWNRISRRSVKPFIFPKRVDHKAIPAFYIDTSGSMSEDEINQGLTEVRSAVKHSSSFVYVTCLDAAIYDTQKVASSGQIGRVKVEGGGGTDMRLMFDHYTTLKPQPNILVCVTDGETPWPDEEPKHTKVIIVLTQPEARYSPTPEWATVVHAIPGGK